MSVIYLIGSLRNPAIPDIANRIENETGYEVFDDWFAAGPIADDSWRDYERGRGLSYPEALNSWAARHVYEFDRHHILRSDIAVLALPAGKSGHLELGWALGKGKKGYVLFDGEPERWDVMYQFCDEVFYDLSELIKCLKQD